MALASTGLGPGKLDQGAFPKQAHHSTPAWRPDRQHCQLHLYLARWPPLTTVSTPNVPEIACRHHRFPGSMEAATVWVPALVTSFLSDHGFQLTLTP